MFDRKNRKQDSVSANMPIEAPTRRRTIVGGPPPQNRAPESTVTEVTPAPAAVATSARGSSSESSTLGPNLILEGSVAFTGTLVVNCRLRGSVCSEDRLVVGSTGDVQGDITVGSAEISGRVQGDIRANKAVRILRGGQVQGDIETPSISMEEGVVFEGRCTRMEALPECEAIEPMVCAAESKSDSALSDDAMNEASLETEHTPAGNAS